MKIFLSIISGLFFSSISAQNITIERLAPLPMNTSNNAVVEGFDNGKAYVYSFGGIDETKIFSGIHLRAFRLDVSENIWEELDPLPDTRGKIASSASRVGDIIYIIGGYHVAANGSEVSSGKVHRFDIKSNSYLSDGVDIPIPIDDQAQVVSGELIYVITGWSDNRNIPQVQVYDTVEDSWAMANTLPNSDDYKVFGSAGTIIDDTIYYYGGAGGFGFRPSMELRKGIISADDPLAIEWSLVTPPESPTAYRIAATVYQGEPYWFGGSEDSYNFDGIAYNGSGGVSPAQSVVAYDSNSNSEEWRSFEIEEMPMDLRSVAELSDSEKVIVGGMTDGQVVSNEVLLVKLEGSSATKEKQAAAVTISPNPVDDKLILDYKGLIRKLEIVDLSGKKVIELGELNPSSVEVDVSDLDSQVYLLQIHLADNRKETLRFFKS